MELFKIVGKLAINGVEEAKKHLQDVSGEGEKTGSKLGSFFSSVGKGAAWVGKTTVKGLGVAAGGILALGTAAVKSYADYEQLVGGVETLFGTRGAKSVEEYAQLVGKSVKDVEAEFEMLQKAQSDVMDNAAEAYMTAGLSANEYMETANSLAAALNQSSASQLESARLADQAIIDMSDNANKMGTSMEAIQNAYNGFSKQNFTMLDNLKLGYGGTKEEMQRLLDDAGKIANTKFDISSFADITEAIHVMQEEMGIAGTTHGEATKTIQGSLGMLKGSWSNLLTGLSDPEADLDKLISNVFESATVVAKNLIPRITQVLTGIATAFTQIVPMLTQEIPKLLQQVLPPLVEGAVTLVDGVVQALPQILNALMGALPMLIEGAITLVNGLLTAIPQIINLLIGALPQIIQGLVAALPQLIPALITGIVSMITTICTVLPQIIQPIIDNLPMIITSIVDALLTNLPALISGVGQLIVALCAALPQILGALWEAIKGIFVLLGEKILGFFEPVKNAISNAWQAMGNVPGLSSMKTMIENVWGAIKNYVTTYINAIKNVVSTVWNSIKNVVSTVLNSIKNVISTAWNAIKTIISSVMKLISSVLKGDWNGVKSAISSILNAIKSVIKSVWDGIKNIIKSVLSGIKNTISSVWNGIKSVISSAVNGIKTIISSVWNGIKGTISGVLSGIKNTVKGGFNDVKNNAVNILKSIPGKIKNVGLDIVKGIGNGITNGVKWIKSKIKSFVGDVTGFMKKLFGIKSPSTVMRDEVGRYLSEGVAVGITANADKAEDASEKLANNILTAAQKKLDTYKTYNDMTLAEEAGFWDGVRVQLKEGTDARLEADKKYLEAKKNLDDQILSAEQELQTSLNDIYKKIADRKADILDSFSLFGDDDKGTDDYYLRLYGQTKALEDYQKQIDTLENRIGGTGLYEAIKNMGLDAHEELQKINSMTDIALDEYVKLFDKRSELAGNLAKDEMGNQVIAETEEAYQKFANKCAELGVEVVTDTSTMENGVVSSFKTIAEKVSTATATIGETIGTHFKNAVNTVSESLQQIMSMVDAFVADFAINGFIDIDGVTGNGTSLADTASLMSTTTAASGSGNERTKEAIAKKNEYNNTVISYLKKIVDVLCSYFPELIEAFDVDVRLDSGVLVGELAPAMDDALGRLSSRKDRGR